MEETLTATSEETTLDVEGMSCGSCVRHIGAALGDLPGIENVSVSLREGKVRVRHGIGLPLSKLLAALDDAGYPARKAS